VHFGVDRARRYALGAWLDDVDPGDRWLDCFSVLLWGLDDPDVLVVDLMREHVEPTP
jgi:hypothetical protein